MSYDIKLRNMASVYLFSDEKILLLYREGDSIVKNLWIGSAGGHFEPAELCDPKACVLRELQEELSLNASDISDLTLRYVTLRCADNEIRQNYYFFANLNNPNTNFLISTEGTLQFYRLDELAELQMPITARYVIDHYIQTGRLDNQLYGCIANDNGVIFTKL